MTDSEKEFAAGRLNISKFTTDKGLTVEAAFPASWKERKSNVTTVLSMYEDGGRGPVWCLIMAKPISEIGARNYRASNFGDLYNQSAAEIEFGSHTRLTSFKKGTLHAYTAFRLSWEGRVKDQDSGKSATRAAHEIRIAAGHFMVLFQITTLGPPNSPEAARILRDYQPLLERIADSLELNSRISLGRSRRPDRVARFLELKAAAEKSDDPVALRDTGYCYETGDGIAKDEKEAARWLQRAAARALTLIRKAAGDEANPIFAATLGELYNLGKDVPQDCVEAVKWFHRAAELGFAPAQFDLGCIYKNGGKGVPSDFTEAFKWARRAAEQNHPGAQGLLGHLYHTGEGVAKNTATAVTWYRKAAEQGYAPSQFKLGILHATADGAPEDFKEAVKWYEKAARQDDTDSQYALGMHHYLGRGVPVDKPKNVSQKIAKTIQV